MKIKKGDHVMVMVGKDKGATGTVIAAYPKENRVLVQGVNMIKKNKKETNQGVRGAKEGGVVTQEAPVNVSNVQIVDPDTKKPARVGYKIGEDGKKVLKEDGSPVRVLRPSGKEI